jgi:IS605 OrfB family transposase
VLLTVKSKLITTEEQNRSLLKTMERFNEACNFISIFAYKKRTFGKVGIQKELYYEIREKFGLSAQMTVRAVGKVAESYKVDKSFIHEFDPHGAIVFDQRILSYKAADTISILTLDGRIEVKIQYGGYRKLELNRVRGQADLIYKNETFYLMIVVDLPESDPIIPDDILEVDFGIANLATTSDNKIFSGKKCTEIRKKFAKIKAILQSIGTYSAKRHLKKISGKERRFKKDTNHCISKEIVQTAKDTNRAIALEDLSGIRSRNTVSKAVRESIGKWAFLELRNYIEYKAKLLGVPVIPIDPKNTSRKCSICGHIAKENRKNQAMFVCLNCGYSENADYNAAKNIKAAVNLPIVLCSGLS